MIALIKNGCYAKIMNACDDLEKMKALYRKKHKEDRLTCHGVAMALNRDGIHTRCGGDWRSSQVKRILNRLGILK